MALIRPVVLIYQEFSTVTTTATTPDLNCLIVGPCYHIMTYADNKADILLSNKYGTLESANPYTLPTTPAITVAEPPNNTAGALLDATSVSVVFDNAHVIICKDSGTQHATIAAATPNIVTISGHTINSGTDLVKAGDRIIVTSSASETFARTVASVDSATQVTLTADLPAVGFTYDSNVVWRFERTLNDQVVASSFYTVTNNQVVIDGGVTLTVGTQGAKSVAYSDVYLAYRSLRQDLQEVSVIDTVDEIEGTLGKIDENNPLALGVFVALQNTTTPVQAYAVESNNVVGHTACRDYISTRKDIYAIVPLTSDPSVLAMWKAHVDAAALPDETNGIPQKLRVVIGSGTLATTSTVIEEQTDGAVSTVTGTAPSTVRLFTAPGVDFEAAGVTPGCQFIVSLDVNGTTRDGTYTVSHVNSATALEVDETIPAAASANASIVVKTADGVTTLIALTAITGLVSAALDDLYLKLTDANGTFVSSGVKAGDVLEMPADPTGTDYTAKSTWVIASVISDNRLLIVNNGSNTSTVENELPHLTSRLTGAALAATGLSYRVIRNLTKDEQVDYLVSVAQSYKSRRVVLVWPDSVSLPDISAKQPGYYLSCAVGGMTSGLPSHQGFTNLGIAGVKQIYDSNTYFNDIQLSTLSQGGWFVFAQDTPTALPYSIHQLTTDTGALETGEYSIVKNFDFVSLYFKDIVDDFLAVYNVTDELLGLIRSALETGIDTLRLRRFAKIGAPLLSGSVTSVKVSATSGDRVVVGMEVGLPKPLNVIELHIVA